MFLVSRSYSSVPAKPYISLANAALMEAFSDIIHTSKPKDLKVNKKTEEHVNSAKMITRYQKVQAQHVSYLDIDARKLAHSNFDLLKKFKPGEVCF
jgi:hypothetical protein